jgi:hypothetical protein
MMKVLLIPVLVSPTLLASALLLALTLALLAALAIALLAIPMGMEATGATEVRASSVALVIPIGMTASADRGRRLRGKVGVRPLLLLRIDAHALPFHNSTSLVSSSTDS